MSCPQAKFPPFSPPSPRQNAVIELKINSHFYVRHPPPSPPLKKTPAPSDWVSWCRKSSAANKQKDEKHRVIFWNECAGQNGWTARKKEGLIVSIRTRVWHSNKQRRGQKQTLSKNVLALYDKNRKVGEG